MRAFVAFLLVFAASFVTWAKAGVPVPLILDTDIGNDIDDALALAMIHALESRGEVKLIAVTITKDNKWAAPYVDLVNTFYGRPDIPIGVVHNGKTPQNSDYLMRPSEERAADGKYIYPHRLLSGANAPDAITVLASALKEQPDHSVVIAQIGFSSNLARFIQSRGGRALAAQKVKLLVFMAGNFQKPQPEYNVYTDPTSAGYLFKNWPTQMVFSGFEIGLQVKFTHESIVNDFSYTAHHPIAEAYNLYLPKGEDRPSWDPTAVLYAIRPDRGYFQLSQSGNVTLGPKNTTIFTPAAGGKCRYLILPPGQSGRVAAVLQALASQPPKCAF
jgi:inosine-uridine nucleoside N-ribohydrolase